LIAATSPRHMFVGAKHVGGRTQRLLKSGEATLDDLRKEWEDRMHAKDKEPPWEAPADIRHQERSYGAGKEIDPDEWREQQAQAAREKRLHLERERELAQLEDESKRKALASRVAEAQERLARRQAQARKHAERRHAEWVQARLRTGLTAVLDKSDPLTRRAIALANHRHLLADVFTPAFDGRAVGGPKLTPRPATAQREGAPRTGNALGTPWAAMEQDRRLEERRVLAEEAAGGSGSAFASASAEQARRVLEERQLEAGQLLLPNVAMMPDVMQAYSSRPSTAKQRTGIPRPRTATGSPPRPMWKHSGVARARAQSARGLPSKQDLTGRS